MTTASKPSLVIALLLALGAPQLAACESSHAAASDDLAGSAAPSRGEQASLPEASRPRASSATAPAPSLPVGVAPPAQAEPASAATRTSGPAASRDLGVRRLVVAHAVAEREPVPSEHPFVAGQERVYAFVEARNLHAEGRELSVVFSGPAGRSVGHVRLSVPAGQRRFRTWAYTRHIDAPGTWQASVVAEDGTVLATETFEVR